MFLKQVYERSSLKIKSYLELRILKLIWNYSFSAILSYSAGVQLEQTSILVFLLPIILSIYFY